MAFDPDSPRSELVHLREELATTFTLPARVEVREEEPEDVIHYDH